MKKLFISVPMRNRTEYAIKASMEQMHKIAEAVFGEELEVIPTYFEDDPPENTNMALWYLGESIKKLSEADRFIGIYDEDKGYRGCKELRHPVLSGECQLCCSRHHRAEASRCAHRKPRNLLNDISECRS